MSQALQEHYGKGVAQLGLELSIASISKMFDSLQEAYKGQPAFLNTQLSAGITCYIFVFS